MNESRRRGFLSTIGEVEGGIVDKADKKVNSTTYQIGTFRTFVGL